MTKIGFYLEEFGKIDADGRKVVENFSDEINMLTNNGRYEEAFDLFLSIKKVVNINAGAGGLNLDDISEKLTRDKLQGELSSICNNIFIYLIIVHNQKREQILRKKRIVPLVNSEDFSNS